MTFSYRSHSKSAWVVRKLAAAASIFLRMLSSSAESLAGGAAKLQRITTRIAIGSTRETNFIGRLSGQASNAARLASLHSTYSTPFHHNSVTEHLAFVSCYRLRFNDRDFTRDRFNDLKQLPADGRVIPGFDGAGIDLIHQAALLTRCDHYASRMRIPRNGFVLEIDPVRRGENKDQNQR